ncbi:MAG: lipid-A-disaccharide synthase [Cytophagales bacterium]|nr:lipid-A-disaccharide synthase [Cytophagales bacterium]
MKYFIVAGERSGDLHASNLIKSLKNKDSEAEFCFWGGDAMEEASGAKPKVHYRDLAYMGYYEVIKNLRTILGLVKRCKEDVKNYQPDVLILIDYPSFNLKIAEFAKSLGIKVFYYISPKVWVWKEKRVIKIKKWVDQMFVIFPFEVDFYKKHQYDVHYIGNPLLDEISAFTKNENFVSDNHLSNKPIIGVLPGSRAQEVSNCLNEMLKIVKHYPNHQFVIAGINTLSKEFYEPFVNQENVSVVYEQTYDVLSHSETALVASGTATLETALFDVPQIVCYRLNPISAFIMRTFIKVKYVSLVNLIGNREIVKELLQNDFTAQNVKENLDKLLFDKKALQHVKDGYHEVQSKMGKVGASDKTADLMVNFLKK